MDAAVRNAEKDYARRPCKETATAYWLAQARSGQCILIDNFDSYSRSIKLFVEMPWRSRDIAVDLARPLSLLEVQRRARDAGKTKALSNILASNPHRDVKINWDFWVWTGEKHELSTYEMFRDKPSEWWRRRNAAVEIHINL